MKMIKITAALALMAIAVSTQAQTAAGISDEDLKRYALTMDSIAAMQQTLTQIITQNVQQNKVMTVARYNELYKIAGDEAKLTAANATAEERAFVKEIADLRQYNIDRINTSFQSLAKDYIGLKAFNAIKKSLDTDENLKKRYESIKTELQTAKQGTPGTKG